MYLKKIFIFLVGLTMLACENDTESDLYSPIQPNQITYTNTIKGIITDRCLRCHTQPPQNGAPMPLTTYEFVKNAVETGPLIDRISREQGTTGMMPNGETRLPQYQINQFIAWRDANYPE